MIKRSPGWWTLDPRTKQGPYRDWMPVKQAWYLMYREVRAAKNGHTVPSQVWPHVPSWLVDAARSATGLVDEE